LAARHGLFVLEDAAQSHGATIGERSTGALGAAAAFSFYATKNMTTGEGGMITTSDADLARRARLLRNQGMEQRYANEVVGLNNRMTDIAAAIGRVQLRRLLGMNERRREVAATYTRGLGRVLTPPEAPGIRHVYHQYTVRTDSRDQLHASLLDHGIRTNVFYPTPVSSLAPYVHLPADVPETTRACQEVLSLPMHPHLAEEEVDRVVSTVNDLLAVGEKP
jgi:perosamine synthetase